MFLGHAVPSLILGFLLAVCTTSTAIETGSTAFEKAMSQSDFRIVPSANRIGPIRIGMTLEEVVKLLGRPEKIDRIEAGDDQLTKKPLDGGRMYFYDQHAFHVGFTPDAVPRVKQIDVWDSRFALENGSHVGGFTSFDVKRWYPDAEVQRFALNVDLPSGTTVHFGLPRKGDYTVVAVYIWVSGCETTCSNWP